MAHWAWHWGYDSDSVHIYNSTLCTFHMGADSSSQSFTYLFNTEGVWTANIPSTYGDTGGTSWIDHSLI